MSKLTFFRIQAGAELGQAQLKLGLDFTYLLHLLILLEIAELAIAIYCWLQLVIANGYLVISETLSLIVFVEKANFIYCAC